MVPIFFICSERSFVDYHAFSDDSLATMYFCVRGALVADDELTTLGAEQRGFDRGPPRAGIPG
jgi:hypothetical protein